MDLTASMAQGLHNAPKLYGDRTVRAPEKISGWQSGLKAAGKVGHQALIYVFLAQIRLTLEVGARPWRV